MFQTHLAKENTLCFKSEQETRFFPVKDIEYIFIFGRININSSFIT